MPLVCNICGYKGESIEFGDLKDGYFCPECESGNIVPCSDSELFNYAKFQGDIDMSELNNKFDNYDDDF